MSNATVTALQDQVTDKKAVEQDIETLGINESPILSNPDNFPILSPENPQKKITTEALKARLEELKQRYPDTEVYYFPSRPMDRLSDGIYVTNMSGKAKLCPKCDNYHLSYNPLDGANELSCVSCDATWKIAESGRIPTNGEKKERKTTVKKSNRLEVDPTFINPQTRDEPINETSNTTKYEYALQELIHLSMKLGLTLAAKDFVDFAKDAKKYQTAFLEQQQKKQELITQQRNLDVQVNSLTATVRSLESNPSAKETVSAVLAELTLQRDEIRKEIAALNTD